MLSIRVAKHDELAGRCPDATATGSAIPPFGNVHHASSSLFSDFGRSVRGAVVCDEHLSRDISRSERLRCLLDAMRDRKTFVEARNNDRNLKRMPVSGIRNTNRVLRMYLVRTATIISRYIRPQQVR